MRYDSTQREEDSDLNPKRSANTSAHSLGIQHSLNLNETATNELDETFEDDEMITFSEHKLTEEEAIAYKQLIDQGQNVPVFGFNSVS